MARKSLSSQITEEVDRIRDLLAPVQNITDPMTSHVIGTALEGLKRIETLCLASMQNVVNAILEDRSVDQPVVEVPAAKPLTRRRSTTPKATTHRKAQ